MPSCPRCGAEVAAGARFCNRCGASLEGRKKWVVPVIIASGCLFILLVFGGMMAAITYPVFQRARQNAQSASCMQNLRQVVIASLSYAEGHEMRLPSSLDEIKPTLPDEAMLKCPTEGERYYYLPLGNLNDIANPPGTVLVRCPRHRLAGYVDGHVARETTPHRTSLSPPGTPTR